MSSLPLQQQALALNDLQACPSFGEPIGELPKQSYSGFYEKDGISMGTWECEPGKLRLNLAVTEFCHIIKGHWILTADSGEVTEVKAGDSFAFDKGWQGTSEVVETVRKVYTIIE
ncbi:cupin domain-containing protein [Dasania sp. GY-MA-18]|uniref:Cupin domain-containing protein n=1 Tax=Dasania phycosphaerae TaxID=2950436 RepID=A0A9J6RPZ7_9GAMM|nr:MULTISPECIES: cupin domain-containing protein [Dasania]MCR8923943.1 cupin domain-containing protein [Dasania sp. GY-MA-18]MCZ0866377.1 cupin domain-containing protein [Dasania phycosphaerae]MCZ0870101.1 cupin domain-containing protein [Dasania phycosphaerae]